MTAFRNYVYDAERMYKAKKDVAPADSPMHDAYKKLQNAKQEYEQAESDMFRAKTAFRQGNPMGYYDERKARTRMNTAEMNMYSAFRTIETCALRLKSTTNKTE